MLESYDVRFTIHRQYFVNLLRYMSAFSKEWLIRMSGDGNMENEEGD